MAVFWWGLCMLAFIGGISAISLLPKDSEIRTLNSIDHTLVMIFCALCAIYCKIQEGK